MKKSKVIPAVIVASILLFTMNRCAVEKMGEDAFSNYKDDLNNQIGQHQVVDNNYNQNNNVYVPQQQTQTVTYFDEVKQQITSYVQTENYDKIKQTGKQCIVTAVDFIFFDQPINGVYFSSLTDSAKRSILITIANIDSAIIEYYPEYKTEISAKYQEASEYLNSRYLGTLESIKQQLQNKTYDAIEDTTNDIKQNIGEGYKKGQSYIKDKYNQWKN